MDFKLKISSVRSLQDCQRNATDRGPVAVLPMEQSVQDSMEIREECTEVEADMDLILQCDNIQEEVADCFEVAEVGDSQPIKDTESQPLVLNSELAESYMCPDCSCRFSSNELLSIHMSVEQSCHRTRHQTCIKDYKCQHCFTTFPRKACYLHHQGICGTQKCSYVARANLQTVQNMKKFFKFETCEQKIPGKSQFCNQVLNTKSQCSKHETTNGGRCHLQSRLSEMSCPAEENCPIKEQSQSQLSDKSFSEKSPEKPHSDSGDEILTPDEECTFQKRTKDKRLYKCQFCEKHYKKKSRCLDHEKSHTGERPFKCKYCDKSFARRFVCSKHENIHTGMTFRCRFCHKSLATKYSLLKHEKLHVDSETIYCEVCGIYFKTKREYSKHKQIHSREKLFQCKFCNKCFVLRSVCLKHEEIHLKSSGTSISANEECKDQEVSHTPEKTCKCQFCGKSFSQKSHCTEHERVHTGEKPFKCKFCDKQFGRKFVCSRHERLHFRKSTVCCQLCGTSIKTREECFEHEKLHSGEELFQVKFYSKGFVESYTPTKHQDIHLAVKVNDKNQFPEKFPKLKKNAFKDVDTTKNMYQCGFCDKRFKSKGHCSEHERIHTGEKPFKCKFCGKSFARKFVCSKHENIHTRKVPFKRPLKFFLNTPCVKSKENHLNMKVLESEVCHESLTEKHDSEAHKFVKTNKKMYKCQYCEKMFIKKAHCSEHERIHTGEKPFQCNFCGKRFARKFLCLKHETIHTRKIPLKRSCNVSLKAACLKSKENHLNMKVMESEVCDESSTLKQNSCNPKQDSKSCELVKTKKKMYKCQYCEKAFNQKAHCSEHERIHTGEKPFQCNFCGKRFARKFVCLKHENIHTRESTFSSLSAKSHCIEPGKLCTNRQTQKISDEKLFNCKFCGKGFNMKSVALKHEEMCLNADLVESTSCEEYATPEQDFKSSEHSDTNKKIYKCQYCDKMYNKKAHCSEHERIHTGEKPFQCNFCGKRFARKFVCLKHEKIHR